MGILSILAAALRKFGAPPFGETKEVLAFHGLNQHNTHSQTDEKKRCERKACFSLVPAPIEIHIMSSTKETAFEGI
jgi:hypothetical protein